MVFFKACPRCSGDMYSERDQYGVYTTCLSCGYLLDVQEKAKRLVTAAQRPQQKAA